MNTYLIFHSHYLQKAMDEKFATQAQIENDTRAYKLQCAKFDEEVNTAKVPFIYYVSTCIAQNLISIPNFSQKLFFLVKIK